MKNPRGFTLIELLIVVAIISILAGIALPNFLEAQVRAKISRAYSDMRTVATALETYAIDYNDYPPNSLDGFGIVPSNLSTPIAFLTSLEFFDPFSKHIVQDTQGASKHYTYNKILSSAEWTSLVTDGIDPPQEAIDHPAYNFGAFDKYGMWRLVSVGPDGVYADKIRFSRILYGSDVPYDATNGTKSFGNVFRLQSGRPFPPE